MTQDTTYDVIVHIIGATIFEILKFLAVVIILERLLKWFKKEAIVQLIVRLLMFAFFVYTALQSHKRSGFDSGVMFAIDCFLLLLLAVASTYPYVRKLLPIGVKRLAWAKDYQRWKIYKSSGCSAGVDSSSKGIQFRAQFAGQGERWANLEIEEMQDFRGWAGISFNIRCDHVYPESEIKLQIITLEGSGYITGVKCQ